MKNKLILTILTSLLTVPSYAEEISGFPNINWGDSIEKVAQNIPCRRDNMHMLIDSNYSIHYRDINNVTFVCEHMGKSEFIYTNNGAGPFFASFNKSGLYKITIGSAIGFEDKKKAETYIESITKYLEDIYGEPVTYRKNDAVLNKIYKNGKVEFIIFPDNSYTIHFYPNGMYKILSN
ncbi:hypothetical protein [uncultured Haemophilus sp.]|uniref:hypothetical protein n=1 Tax=uncultured Haemophilus sp. TaxID=237779 RepID=UPI00258E8087|nr:hypothetical protein [uncultured Haemophilus sp.]